jgi:ketosteroid isomerase-like protein
MHALRSNTLRLSLAVGLLLIAACAWASDESDMKSKVAKWEASYNAGDLAAVAAMYTEDGCRMPPNAVTANGRAGILKQLQDSHDGAPKVKLGLSHAESNGDLGYASGTYEIIAADGMQLDQGKWMNVSMSVGDNDWLIKCDIWNSNNPLPAQ